MASKPLAIVSMACRYPEAATPERLWRNVLRGRRAFRALPPERIDLASYAALGRDSLGIVPARAGLITDWQFDRAGFKIPSAAFAATDLAHWLALETAVRALAAFDGRVPGDPGRTAVVVANTLTGEFSRATALGLRAPFLDGLLAEVAETTGLSEAQILDLRGRFTDTLLERLGEPNEETLAGGLANTIAGRIANYLDLKGGAFSVDAACASSLVAMATAAEMLAAERVDQVLVGAVDVSLDPFELVGFSRVGALASEDMRVFDARAQGFWPGEGAAFVLLMRAETAKAHGLAPLATLRGWGLSTDGAGGLIRPTVDGQVAAIRQACLVGDLDPADLDFVEAHGTGTPTGDPVEVRALATVRANAAAPLPIGSIKANIGHTKAAAGLAGLIKVVEALAHGVIPPHVTADVPHPVFAEVDHRVAIARTPSPLPDGRAGRAGVSSFGFGGVNAHLVIEGPGGRIGPVRAARPRPVPRQEADLFLFAATDQAALSSAISELHARAGLLSLAEMGDAAASLAADLGKAPRGPHRAAIVAEGPEELERQCALALARLAGSSEALPPGLSIGLSDGPPAIGFLFPGQAAPVRPDGGAWAARFGDGGLPALRAGWAPTDTACAQPMIAAASLWALRLLTSAGIKAGAALGHSLGELAALAWAHALPQTALVPLAAARGEAFQRHAVAGGGMLRVNADAGTSRQLASDPMLSIACENGPEETVVAGPSDALRNLAARASAAGIDVVPLNVSHAFHHPHMAPVVPPFRAALNGIDFRPCERPLLSSVSGDWLTGHENIPDLLCRQLMNPVRFREALVRLGSRASFLIEVGPGQALARLARSAGFTAVSVDACGPSLVPLLSTLGQAFVAGVEIDPSLLFVDRDLEPFDRLRPPDFLENPCGRRSATQGIRPSLPSRPAKPPAEPSATLAPVTASGLLDLVQQAVAHELGLAPSAIGADERFDTRLHLGSLAVARIVAKVAKAAGAPMPRAPTEFAGATSRELADAIGDLKAHGGQVETRRDSVEGVAHWIRTCGISWVPAPAPPVAGAHNWLRLRPGEVLPLPAPPELLIDARPIAGEELDLTALYLSVREAARAGTVRRLAVLADRQPISALLRSLALEGRFASVRLVDAGADISDAAIAAALSSADHGYAEVRLDPEGRALSPRFGPSLPERRTARPLGPQDVIWVTGGARGIAAECALALARRTGAALILSSRSPADSPDVAAILQRCLSDGVRVVHARADLLDSPALAAALGQAVELLGPPTVLLHAAALNRPARIEDIDAAALAETLAPKIYAFGSIIGRLGLAGETHYALANALMVDRLARHARENPGLLALAIEWSVWGGVGMGEALGVLERLQAEGVDPLGVDEAIDAFLKLVETGAAGDLVVTSRFGPPPDLDIGPAPGEAPRFLDRVLVHYPGIELVTQTRLWPGRDQALADHRVDGSMILPGVMSLEAMAQVARALVQREEVAEISAIRFTGAIAVPEGGAVDLRIAALAREDGAVDAVIRSSEDGFATDRARATLRFGTLAPSGILRSCEGASEAADALYGALFFHGRRFRRVERLSLRGSREVSARLREVPEESWFAPFDEDRLVLGDPAARDAALHCLQALVGHRRVVPVSAARIRRFAGGAIRQVEARELQAKPGRYLFQIQCFDGMGRLLESWEEAEFRAVGPHDPEAALRAFPALLHPLLERLAREALLDDVLTVRLGPLGAADPRRADGRPLDPRHSRSHGAVGLSVAGTGKVGCDLEWERNFAAEPPPLLAFTLHGAPINGGEAWVAGEALRKIGLRPPARLCPMEAPGLPAMARLFEADGARLLVASLPTPEGRLLAAIAEEWRGPIEEDVPAAPRREAPPLSLPEPAE